MMEPCAQNCLMGCTEAQSRSAVLETLAASGPGREALREAMRTVLRRWNHGAEDQAPAEVTMSTHKHQRLCSSLKLFLLSSRNGLAGLPPPPPYCPHVSYKRYDPCCTDGSVRTGIRPRCLPQDLWESRRQQCRRPGTGRRPR